MLYALNFSSGRCSINPKAYARETFTTTIIAIKEEDKLM
jgi:hypothetical protein